MENSERNSLFSVLHGRKIAFSRPWFPSLGTENSIEYAKCPSTGTENSEHNSLFSVLRGRKIAFSRPWFPSLGTENNINGKKGSVPIRRNSIRRILKMYIVWVNAVVLWKNCTRYSVILSLRNIPIMQHYVLLILRHSRLARKMCESLRAFLRAFKNAWRLRAFKNARKSSL